MADAFADQIDDTGPKPEAVAQHWRARIGRAERRQKNWHPWWEHALKSYSPSVKDSPTGYQDHVRTNRAFTIVERKAAELFYQKPDLTVEPSPLLEGLGDMGHAITSAHGAILNWHLGLEGVNVKNLARRVVFDYLLFGFGVTKMGYRSYTRDVQTEVPNPLTGVPELQTVPVPIKSECFWETISPKAFLFPADFQSTEFDKSPWLATRLPQLTLAEAKRLYGDAIPQDFKGSGKGHDEAFDAGDAPDSMSSADLVTGVEIWYRTGQFTDEPHPDHITQLVLIDGISKPVQHRPSPYQTFDQQGRLTPDSLVGYPIHVLVIRTMTDAAYLMSDVNMAAPIVSELDKFRTQQVQQRDATILRYLVNTDVLPMEDLEKLIEAPVGGAVGLPGAAFADINRTIAPMPHGPYPRENFTINDYLDNDLARTHAIDATSAGTSAESGLTATEANLRQANVNVRLGWEQGWVADWYVLGASKYASLMQKFVSVEDAAVIVGMKQAQVWDAWRAQASARLSFKMAPDSSLRNDTPLARKQLQDLYTYLVNDPSLNRPYLNRKLLEKYHLDPAQALVPQNQIPGPKPAPPTLSLSFKGEDLNPMSPQSPIVIDLLTKAGVQIDPKAITNAMQLGEYAMKQQHAQATAEAAAKGRPLPPHGGKVAQAESLDKHQVDETGAMQGTGQLTPAMATPGGLQ